MIHNFLKIFSQALLFILLLIHGALIYLSLIHEGIPISNSLVQKYTPIDFSLKSKKTLFFLPFHVKITEVEITQKTDTLFKFYSPEIFLSWQPNIYRFNFNNWKIHSYTGQISSIHYPNILELKELNVTLNDSKVQNASILLSCDDKLANLKYSAKKYASRYTNLEKHSELPKLNRQSYPSIEQSNSYYSLINAFHASKNSFLECYLERTDLRSYSLRTKLYSESIEVFNHKIKNLEIDSEHGSDLKQTAVSFKAANFTHQAIPIQSSDIRGELKLNNKMQVASLKLGANACRIKEIALNSITGEILPVGSDIFRVNGMLYQEDHSLNIHGDYEIDAGINKFLIKAYLDLDKLKKDYAHELLAIEIKSPIAAFAEADIIVDKNLSIHAVNGVMQIEKTTINSMPLQHLRSNFQFINKRLMTSNSFKINHRTSSINTIFDLESGDYSCSISGYNFSSDLNPIMPKWWLNTFKDFSYNDNTICIHDFNVYGTLTSPSLSLLVGSVKAENLNYKGVLFKHADVSVIKRKTCTQITLKDIRTQEGKAKGAIKITKRPDGFKKPESIRTKIKGELTLKTAEKLLGRNVRKTLSNFQSPHTHTIEFESVFFNPYYTENKNKSYYDLSIEKTKPILFFNRPFDQLTAKIYGRNNQHHIRSAHAEFAGGQIDFEADILETSSNDPKLRINLSLSNCDYKKSIQDIFQNKYTNVTTKGYRPLDLDLTLKSDGALLNLTKHNGFGNLEINGPGLGKIHLLGPLSKALEQLKIPLGVFSLNQLESNFMIREEQINVKSFEINGNESYVSGQGQIFIPTQEINFKMSVDLLKNKNLSFSKLGSLGEILNPLTRIFNFSVSGTIQNQKWRSAFDPRNLFE